MQTKATLQKAWEEFAKEMQISLGTAVANSPHKPPYWMKLSSVSITYSAYKPQIS